MAEACGRLLELLRQPSQFVGSDMAAYICVNSGVRGRGELIDGVSNWHMLQASENIVMLETLAWCV